MTFKKQHATAIILIIVIVMLILAAIFNNNHTVYTSDILIDKPWEKEIRIVNSDYMKHYLYSAAGFYKDLPVLVRIAYTIIQLSCLALLVLLYTLFWDVRRRKASDKSYAELKDRYIGKLRHICTSETDYSAEQARSELGLGDDDVFSYQQKLLLIDLFLELRMQIQINRRSIGNLQKCVAAFGLQNFMEERLVTGKDSEKMKVIQAVRLLHMEVTDSHVTTIINHRDSNLKKAARLYYIISNEEDPFRYMEGRNNGGFIEWDMLETHQIFEDCRNTGKKLPSFIPAMNQVNNNSIVEFFIKETAYWGSDKEMEYLRQYLDSEDESLRKAALESINLRKEKGTEDKLKDIYFEQPEDVKRLILYTLMTIAPAQSVEFFQEAFSGTSSLLTKRMALKCMWKAGENGKAAFESLKGKCGNKEKILFMHVENNIIDREVLNLHNINVN